MAKKKRNWWNYPGTSKGETPKVWRRRRKAGRKPRNIGGTTHKKH